MSFGASSAVSAFWIRPALGRRAAVGVIRKQEVDQDVAILDKIRKQTRSGELKWTWDNQSLVAPFSSGRLRAVWRGSDIMGVVIESERGSHMVSAVVRDRENGWFVQTFRELQHDINRHKSNSDDAISDFLNS
jgi:hypothetical protein